jgi:hypothetical protein
MTRLGGGEWGAVGDKVAVSAQLHNNAAIPPGRERDGGRDREVRQRSREALRGS